MVVLHHLENQTSRLGMPALDIAVLQAGVDIFFVISGFIMWITTEDRQRKTAISFMRDRIIRIVPLYWIVTAFFVFILYLRPHYFYTASWESEHIIKSFFFIATEHPRSGLYHPVLIPGWTLNLEMFFYLIFAGAMALDGGRLVARAGILLIALSLFVLAGAILPNHGILSFYTNDIIIEFAAGIVLGALYLSRFKAHCSRPYLLLLAGFGGLLLSATIPLGLPRSVEWGVPATLIVAGAALGQPISARYLEHLGDWSYSLYLTHPIILAASHKAWTIEHLGLPLAVFPFLAVGACIAAAAFVFRFVEVPSTAAFRRATSALPRPLSNVR